MKHTFRSWSWEYGLGVLLLSGVVMSSVSLAAPEPWPQLMVLATFPYCWYWGYLACLWRFCPRRGDLPEWQAYRAKKAAAEVELTVDPDDYPLF